MPEFLSVNAARDHYAEPVLADVQALAEKVPDPVSEVLSFIEDHLFDLDLFTAIKTRFAGSSPYPLGKRFRRAVGSPLGRYLHGRRMKVAAALLEHTDFTCNEIGIAVGYERAAFYKAFAAWPLSKGLSPARWRDHARQGEPVEPPEEEPASDADMETRLAGWRQALLMPWTLGETAASDPVGALLEHPGADFIVHLVSHYPSVADRCRRLLGEKPTGRVMVCGGPAAEDPWEAVKRLAFESFKARRLESALAGAPSPLDAAFLRAASPMKSFVHYEVLLRAGGAAEARAGLEPCHPSVADLLPSYRAKAALGVAREALDAGDFHTAEMELGIAEVQLAAAGPSADPVTQPGILAARAELLYRQGRWPEAASAASRAADAYRRLGCAGRAAKALVLREAALGRGGPGDSVAELENALAAVDEAMQPEVALQLLSALAVAYARQGDQEKTEVLLARLAALGNRGENDR